MDRIKKIIGSLTKEQKEIIQKAGLSGSTILFNIKGMIQVLHRDGPFDFIEMGHEDIEVLQEKGLIITNNEKEKGFVLHDEKYKLSPLGQEVAKALTQTK